MQCYSNVTLVGNSVRDPQIKTLPSGNVVADFGIAVSRKFKDGGGQTKEEVAFIDLQAWGKLAEIVGQYVTKGKPIFVSGRIRQESWEAKDGTKRNKLMVVVDNLVLLGSRDGGGNGQQDDECPGTTDVQRTPRPAKAPSQRPPADRSVLSDQQEFDPSDIPFAWSGRQQQDI